MSEPKTRTLVAEFAGQDRIFRLRIGEIGELETLSDAGLAAIYSRLATLQFRLADVRETIRLGLIGGGMVASSAAFLVKRYVDADDMPINPNVPLALAILQTTFEGARASTQDDGGSNSAGARNSGAGSGEAGGSGHPATSPPSSPPASSQGSAPTP